MRGMSPQKRRTNHKGLETYSCGWYGHKQDSKRKANNVVCIPVCCHAFVGQAKIWVNIRDLISSWRLLDIQYVRY